MINAILFQSEHGDLTFTQPFADGIMYCNNEMCFADGKLAGPHPFIVGHRSLKDAAQWWYLERSQLVNSYVRMLGRDYPFMEKESDNARQEEAEDNQAEAEERPQAEERPPQA